MKILVSIVILLSKQAEIELHLINPVTTNVLHHIETSQLICIANRFNGFYIMGNIGS